MTQPASDTSPRAHLWSRPACGARGPRQGAGAIGAPGAKCRVGEGGAGHRPTLWRVPEVYTLCRHLKNKEKLILGRYCVPRVTMAMGERGAQGVREGCGLFQGGGKDVLGIFWWGPWVNPRGAEHMQGQAEGQRARGRRGLHRLAFYDQHENNY